jgi:hypothetical protein
MTFAAQGNAARPLLASLAQAINASEGKKDAEIAHKRIRAFGRCAFLNI